MNHTRVLSAESVITRWRTRLRTESTWHCTRIRIQHFVFFAKRFARTIELCGNTSNLLWVAIDETNQTDKKHFRFQFMNFVFPENVAQSAQRAGYVRNLWQEVCLPKQLEYSQSCCPHRWATAKMPEMSKNIFMQNIPGTTLGKTRKIRSMLRFYYDKTKPNWRNSFSFEFRPSSIDRLHVLCVAWNLSNWSI